MRSPERSDAPVQGDASPEGGRRTPEPVPASGRRPDGSVLRPAAFLDRDGTIIRERRFLADPDGVELIPGTAAALRALSEAGYALVVVTNQSGIARGFLSEAEFRAVQRRVEELLSLEGVRFDGVYFCPHHPDITGPCDCRKPGLALYRRAAAEHGLDLARSIYIGDRPSDVLPACTLGGAGHLVRTGYGAEVAPPDGVAVHADLAAVAADSSLAG